MTGQLDVRGLIAVKTKTGMLAIEWLAGSAVENGCQSCMCGFQTDARLKKIFVTYMVRVRFSVQVVQFF